MTLAAPPPPALPAARDDTRLLPAGTRLDEFEIVRPLGVGGFGIVYLALDRSLLRQVALKEFMPAELAARGGDGIVRPRSPDHADQFQRSLEAFFNEARLLAPFNHPALVRVHRFWKANGTAYMAMQYCPGMTLVDARRAMHAPPDETWLRAVVEPVLDALERLHRAGVFHRDISPDNILLLPNGRPILLDFGSARRVVGPGTKSLTAVLKPNFAPVEQYGHAAGMPQGPWTDLYALGATVHFLLSGEAPTPAVMRVVQDVRTPLAASGTSFPGVSAKFLAAIDWASAVAPQDRPQSVEALRGALGEAPAATAGTVAAAPRKWWASRRARIEIALAASGALGLGAWATVTTTSLFAIAAPTSASVPALTAAPRVVPALTASPRVVPAPTAMASVESTSPAVQAPQPGSTALAAAVAPPSTPVAARPAETTAPAAKSVVSPSPAPRVAPWKRAAAATLPPTRRSEASDLPYRSPAEACAGRNFFARAICVSRQCQTAGLRGHPECVEARRIDEQRQRRLDR